jgi:heme/copper-type cytochrome/quinol oxidase subunit 2
MDIELYSILSTLILLCTIITIVFAVSTYVTFRARQRRRATEPMREIEADAPRSQFFRKYQRSR